ncbi:molybdopterin-dependent oxidoreductase [Ramlibacter sp.]|uniref:molybdopterin-dependent oxidoreductase n=1 Tax=Ramlibacter sp. TaxID=1917967 RepID=UPI003D0B3D78
MRHYTATHWGIYEVASEGGRPALKPFAADPSPSPIGLSMLDACTSPNRVMRPAVRKSVLRQGLGAAREQRGCEPFVEIGWDEALDLVAGALKTTIAQRGNEAVFGGSYGWASAGRFHHAQSQVHRFLNALGGYVRHTESYSLGAAHVIMGHIVAPMRELTASHTSWDVLRTHTKLFVSFGGAPWKNSQVSPGGVGRHTLAASLRAMAAAGTRFVNVSPVSDNIDTGGEVEWIATRPNTDTAFMIGIAYVLYTESLHDRAFLQSHCVGFERFAKYLEGADDGQPKTPEWAAAITGVPASRIAALARELAATRSIVTASWAMQRAHHGEQPYWMVLTLAAMLGQIGLPGGGFGVGYGALNMVGSAEPRYGGPTLSQGTNPVKPFIPCARIADMLLHPGETFRYNGGEHRYPDIDLVYWCGGNPFHHHQDINRLRRAWHKPSTIVVHEQFWTANAKMADIVLPATTTLERDDIGQSQRERFIVAMKKVIEPVGESRHDFAIFADLAARLGVHETFTENRSEREWLRKLYEDCHPAAERAGLRLPAFERFWADGLVDTEAPAQSVVMLEAFRQDPVANALKTPSGKIEIFSERLEGFGNDDCRGHPRWYEPVEWLGSAKAQRFPLHMISDQPHTKLHSQLDHSALSLANKVRGREPIMVSDTDAKARGIADGDIVRVFNDRGSCLAGARVSAAIRPGVVKLSTGAWWDPVSFAEAASLDKHGNANVLTIDVGTSALSQGCSAQTCLVQLEKFEGDAPPVTAFRPPVLERNEP